MKMIAGEFSSTGPDDAGQLSEGFQAFFLHKTPPVVGVISLEGG